MKERLAVLKKEAEAMPARSRHAVDDEGRAILRMNVKDDSGFLSSFSVGEKPVISDEVAAFLENSTVALPPAQPLALHIQSDCIDEGERVEYRSAIKEYYTGQYVANENESRRNRRIVLLLALCGILILSMAIFLEYQAESLIWAEVIDIPAWVFLWEAVDIGAFRNHELRANRLRYLSLIEMKIIYHSTGEKG